MGVGMEVRNKAVRALVSQVSMRIKTCLRALGASPPKALFLGRDCLPLTVPDLSLSSLVIFCSFF